MIKQIFPGMLIFLAISTTFFSPFVQAKEDWELLQEKDGIQVFQRSVEESSFCEYKGIAVIEADINVLVEVLKDVQAVAGWFAFVDEFKILRQSDAYNLTIYVSIDLPWPVSNRDVVVDAAGVINDDSTRVLVDMSSLKEPLVPIEKGYIRITDLTSSWTMNSISGHPLKTRVAYEARLDPAGHIPAFLINLNVRRQVHLTLANLGKMAKQPKYIDAAKRSAHFASPPIGLNKTDRQ